jgi:hypothetical protein
MHDVRSAARSSEIPELRASNFPPCSSDRFTHKSRMNNEIRFMRNARLGNFSTNHYA